MGNAKHDAKNAVVLRYAPMENSKEAATLAGVLGYAPMGNSKEPATLVINRNTLIIGVESVK